MTLIKAFCIPLGKVINLKLEEMGLGFYERISFICLLEIVEQGTVLEGHVAYKDSLLRPRKGVQASYQIDSTEKYHEDVFSHSPHAKRVRCGLNLKLLNPRLARGVLSL